MNPPNNIQNGFFTPVSPFFIKIRKLTVFFRVTLTPRLYHNLSVCGWGADGSFVPKNRRSASSACPLQFFGNKKNHMPDARGACRAYDWDLIELTPSTACELLPPPAGGPPPSRREVWGVRVLSKPRIQPRVQGRNPARFKGGYGVPRGFKGGSKPSAPCGRLSEAEHPKRKGATLLRPLSAVNRNRPGNSHSRASAPCDFRFPPCFFPHSGRMAPIPLIP